MVFLRIKNKSLEIRSKNTFVDKDFFNNIGISYNKETEEENFIFAHNNEIITESTTDDPLCPMSILKLYPCSDPPEARECYEVVQEINIDEMEQYSTN